MYSHNDQPTTANTSNNVDNTHHVAQGRHIIHI